MKFKEIKPGMVIHCPTEEDKIALSQYLMARADLDFTYTVPKDEYGDFFYVSNIDEDPVDVANDEITEFSDLIEPDSDIAPKTKWEFDPEKGYFEGKPASDSPIDSPMTAVEVLEWLDDHYGDGEYKKVFGVDLTSAEFLYEEERGLSAQEVVDRITAYEAAKKAPNPVEVEWVKLFRIIQIQDNGTKKCVYEEEANPYVAYGTGEEGNYSFDPKYGAENVLKKYVSEHDGRYIVVIEDVCRVKEDES